MKQKKVEVMIDLETLGTSPGCAILSIAAVPFNIYSPIEDFYERVASASCIECGLVVDDATVQWWNKQDPAARTEAFGGETLIATALTNLTYYLNSLGDIRVWGNGASFDVPILEAAYKKLNLPVPWKYYDSMCYRTLKNLYKGIPAGENTKKHNALEDARHQAQHAEKILRIIGV